MKRLYSLLNQAGAGEASAADTQSFESACLEVSGTFVATVTFEGQVSPGGAWHALAATPLGGGSAVTETSSAGAWRLDVRGLVAVRVRVSAYTSGQIDAHITLQ